MASEGVKVHWDQDTAGKVKNDMVDEVMLPSTGSIVKLCQQGS